MDRVCFISRAGFLDPFVIRHTVGLGQGLSSRVTEVNVPYVATVGPDPSPILDGLVSFIPPRLQTQAMISAARLSLYTGICLYTCSSAALLNACWGV